MTVNQRYCFKFHLQPLARLAFCNVTAVAAAYTWNELIKAIRCHYHRQKSPDNGKELLSSEEDNKESDTVSDNEENS